MRLPDLNLGEWAVLGLLVEQPRHGFALAAELRPDGAIGRAWRVGRPVVYRSVDRLVAAGLARPGRIERGARGPERRVVHATAAGRRALLAWLDQPVDHLRDVRSALLVKLLLRDRLGLAPEPLLEPQRARFAQLAPARTDDVIGRWRAASLAATLHFLDDLLGPKSRQ